MPKKKNLETNPFDLTDRSIIFAIRLREKKVGAKKGGKFGSENKLINKNRKAKRRTRIGVYCSADNGVVVAVSREKRKHDDRKPYGYHLRIHDTGEKTVNAPR